MFFSVIIPTYNRPELTRIAVDSVLAQSFDNFELIVVDDGSDPAFDFQLSTFNLIRHKENQGVSAARNTGLKAAHGEWICFLDSDDRWRKDKLSVTAEYIQKFPEYMIFHTDEIWYSSGRLINQKKKHKRPQGDVFEKSLEMCCIGPSTSCVHRSLFQQHGLFDEELPACEDYDLWLRLTCRYPVKLIPHPLTIKEGGREDQLSARHSLDNFRIRTIDKLLKSGMLNEQQKKLALKKLREKLEIYFKGCKNNSSLSQYHQLLSDITSHNIQS